MLFEVETESYGKGQNRQETCALEKGVESII